MKFITSNVEARLKSFADSSKNLEDSHYVLRFNLSQLSATYRNDFHIKIATNILYDIFRQDSGEILRLDNYDIFVIYKGNDKELLSKAVFQVRYLFFDDPLANHPDGRENENFCIIYDIDFQHFEFGKVISDLLSKAARKEMAVYEEAEENEPDLKKFSRYIELLEQQKITKCLRSQPVCSIKSTNQIKPIFHEIYVNISSLRKLSGMANVNYNITENKWLFLYATRILDKKVIEEIGVMPENFLHLPISLNLNIETVLSDEFEEFSEIAKDFKCQVIIEISVSDVFTDVKGFDRLVDLSAKRNHKICLDGLNNETFIQLNRKKLGFDLAKLQWNADMKSDLREGEHNEKLIEAVQLCGSNRLILCRCDDINAIDYGHELGISLFQGRFPDRVLNPESTVIN